MGSKYDTYWAARLDEIRDAIGRAATGVPVTVGIPGLRSLGKRQSWYGVAEVRGRTVIRSSMAHATSLGKTVADSGICSPWPDDTFRFAISPADVLTITMAGDGPARSPRTAGEIYSRADPVSAGPAGVAGLLRDDPRQLGPYRLLGRLGAGGMGQVFLGRTAGGRLIAVKVIRAELAGDSGFRVRFAREVAAARTVNGLFTAVVVDADVEGPVPWLATAYVAGPSLADEVESHGPLPVGSVLTLAAGLAEGLAAIHAAGVVHRDLKPSNVLLAQDGPRVIDFGISRAAGQYTLTQSGSVMGSPGFMSPEQAEGDEVGPESDVFSLGAVLTFAVTGEGPFGSGPSSALLYRVVHHQPRTDHLPGQIRPLIERCLAKDAGQRPSAADLLEALGAAEAGEGSLPEPPALPLSPRTVTDFTDEVAAQPTLTAEQLPRHLPSMSDETRTVDQARSAPG
jgi:serine/threonine protein kinase